MNCIKCDLCITRRNIVVGNGNKDSNIMFIGDAPCLTDDKHGLPFVGKTGIELNKYLYLCGFDRANVYITYAVKCRTPNNRVSSLNEIYNCREHLIKEIEDVNPKIIVLLGTIATMSVLGEGINYVKGKPFAFNNRVVFVTYNPSYTIKNPDKRIIYFNHFKNIVDMYRLIDPWHAVKY